MLQCCSTVQYSAAPWCGAAVKYSEVQCYSAAVLQYSAVLQCCSMVQCSVVQCYSAAVRRTEYGAVLQCIAVLQIDLIERTATQRSGLAVR